MSSRRGSFDLACKCKNCSLDFFIYSVDKIIDKRDEFSISQVSCPYCRRNDIDVNITVAKESHQSSASSPSQISEDTHKLEEALTDFLQNKSRPEAAAKFTGFLLGWVQNLAER